MSKKEEEAKQKKPKRKNTPKNPKKKEILWLKYVDYSRVQEPRKLQEYISWITIPKRFRKPKTQQQFAKQIGVHPDTLTGWKMLPGFWEEVKNEEKNYFMEDFADVFQGLVERAKEGNVHAVRLFLEYVCGFTGGKDTSPEPKKELGLSEERQRQIHEGLERMDRAIEKMVVGKLEQQKQKSL